MYLMLAEIWVPRVDDLRLFSPELALVVTLAALLIVPMIAGRGSQLAAGVALIGVLVTLVLTVMVERQMQLPALRGGYRGFSPNSAMPMLLADNFAVFFKLFLMLFLSLIIGLWLLGPGSRPPDRGRQPGAPEFFVLLLTSALGMAMMVSTLNLLVMVIAIEMASLPSFAIVGTDKASRRSAEASLKFVIFGAASAAIMVYGVSLLYGCFGTLDIPTIAEAMLTNASRVGLVASIGVAATLMGIFFKISAAPFHFWCPDVFEGAPIEITTWLSVASKAAGLGLLLRIVATFQSPADISQLFAPLGWGIGLAAAVTCTIGNLAALRQESVKRMLAYSSIAHAGYMMMAGAILVPKEASGHVNHGLGALIAYVFIYLMMNLGAFGVTALVSWQTGSDDLSAFKGLGRRAPALALPMAVCLFSLVGLPPLAGFTAKWWLLYALGTAAANQSWLWALIIVAVINTAISLYYYVGVINQMYLLDDPAAPAVPAPFGGLVIVNACAIGLLLFGTVFFNPLVQKANRYASGLLTSTPAFIKPQVASHGGADAARNVRVPEVASTGAPVGGRQQP